MNYIKALQAENATLKAQLAAGAAALRGFRAHLYSPKFSGVESDGGRKDWIATGDVLAHLSTVDSALTTEPGLLCVRGAWFDPTTGLCVHGMELGFCRHNCGEARA